MWLHQRWWPGKGGLEAGEHSPGAAQHRAGGQHRGRSPPAVREGFLSPARADVEPRQLVQEELLEEVEAVGAGVGPGAHLGHVRSG